jgi:hypothetical protein
MSPADQLHALAPDLARSALGKQALAASPWQFIPAAAAKLAQPSLPPALADELRLTMAVALGRLGLRSPALQALDACQHDLTPQVCSILELLPNDIVSASERIATCRANLEATRSGDRDRLLRSFSGWEAAQSSVRAFRAGPTTVLQSPDGRWLLFVDDAAVASTIDGASTKGGPAYVDGLHLPAVLRKLMQAAMAPKGEVQPRFILLAGSDEEALAGLSLQPLTDLFQTMHVEVWAGLDCPQRVRRDAESRIESALGSAIGLPGTPTLWPRWPRGAIAEELVHVSSLQDQLTSLTRSRVDAWNARTDACDRVTLASAQHWRGLRILLPTTRFSTYVQHAAHDLAHAFDRLGCETRVVQEPDEFSHSKPLAVLRATESFHPDIVVFINTLRTQLPEAAPSNVPAVTWVQDALAHLFSDRAGRTMGARDFVVGHLHPELFETFAFPRSRTMAATVLASDQKFHGTPVHASLRERFACEVAYASHQSQTPDEIAAKIIAKEPSDSLLARATRAALPVVIDCVHSTSLAGGLLAGELRAVAKRVLAHAGNQTSAAATNPTDLATFLHQVVHPIAERALRQQMVGWAADLCERRGWRLHLYGKGWERSRFAKHARGELHHGEELRAAYQCARTHLHVGLGGAHHQRVLECALSGGCSLVRLKSDDARLLEWWAQNELARDASPEQFCETLVRDQPFLMTPVADHWQAMMAHAAMDRLGIPQQHDHRGMQAVSHEQLRGAGSRDSTPLEAAWLMGDPSETAFWSRESFDRAASALVESDRRRESFAKWQREAAIHHFSLESFASRILQLVASSLRSSKLTNPAMSRSG